MLQAVDEAIGGSTTFGITGIMEHLRTLGIEDNTIVVFFSDNGWHWGEHRTRAKLKPYEESIRSPLFVRYPKLAPLHRSESRMALNIDLCPTFAELAGAGVPITQDGTSLIRVLDGTAPTWRTDFLTEGWPNNRVWASVRDGQWKYIEIPVTQGDPDTTFELELYDLIADPYELTNVAALPEHASFAPTGPSTPIRTGQIPTRRSESRPGLVRLRRERSGIVPGHTCAEAGLPADRGVVADHSHGDRRRQRQGGLEVLALPSQLELGGGARTQ
jgi:hypothetical protein